MIKVTFISADGSRLAIVGEKGIREAWDGLTGALLHRSTTSRNIPGYAAFSPDGETLWEFGTNSGFSAWAWPSTVFSMRPSTESVFTQRTRVTIR